MLIQSFARALDRLGKVGDRLSFLGPTLARLTVGLVFVSTGWGKLHSLPDAPGARGRAMQEAMMGEGLLLRVVKDTINFAPPLIITEAEVDELFARFTRALAVVERAESVT